MDKQYWTQCACQTQKTVVGPPILKITMAESGPAVDKKHFALVPMLWLDWETTVEPTCPEGNYG